jgi:Fe-Mn family superoxide dismutase
MSPLKSSLLTLFFLASSSPASSVDSEPDLASEHNQAYTILPDNTQTFSAMSVGAYSLPALPYAYNVSCPPLQHQDISLSEESQFS